MTISKCLPEFKPHTTEKSLILNPGMMHVLTYHLPSVIRMHDWSLLFSLNRDGYSHISFFDKLEGAEYTILVIKDTKGHVFGAFCTEEWRSGTEFFGTGESFVFTFHDGDDLQISPSSGEDENY